MKNMSKSFDNKIKESLENFEMPYDAAAWAAFEKQLPQGGGAATGSSKLGWKLAAIFVIVATVATSVWYVNSLNEPVLSEKVEAELLESVEQASVLEGNTPETANTTVATEERTKSSETEKPRVSDAKKAAKSPTNTQTESANANSADAENTAHSAMLDVEKEAISPTEKPVTQKIDAKPLVARFNTSSLTACVGEEVSFINESSDLKAKMAWDFGDGAASDQLNPSHSYVIAGTYSVNLKAENGVKTADRTLIVTVNPRPTATLEASQKLSGYDAIPYYHFETVLQPNQTARWSFTDGSVVDGAVADHLFREAGRSEAILTVKNNYGCVSSDTWQVENREPFLLLAPTGFSPDGDGNNDEFMPGALATMDVDFEMVISDQKGQEVFRTKSPTNPWNGKMQNQGHKLDAGVYVWTVVLKDEIVRKKTFTGTITILR